MWSDGEPIDCDDAVLMWAANSGTYDEGETVLFDTAGTTGFELQEKPDCEDGDKDFTLTYTQPYSDWIAGTGRFCVTLWPKTEPKIPVSYPRP